MKEEHKKSEDFKEDASDVISRQCKELDAWREKYRALVDEHNAFAKLHDAIVEESASMSWELIDLRKKLKRATEACEEKAEHLRKVEDSNSVLQKSNMLMEAGMKRCHEKCESLAEQLNIARAEVLRLRERTFIERLLNR